MTQYVKWEDREEYVLDYKNLPIVPFDMTGAIKDLVKHARMYIVMYGFITVGDLYDLICMYIDIPKKPDVKYTDYKRGWTRYSDICVQYRSDGVTVGLHCEPISRYGEGGYEEF